MMKWFNNMRITKKLVISFLIVSVLAAGIGVFGIVNTTWMGRMNSRMYEENTVALQHAGDAGVVFQQIRYNSLNLIFADPADKETLKNIADNLSLQFGFLNDSLLKLDAAVQDPEIAAQVDKVITDWNAFQPIMKKVNEEFISNGVSESLAQLTEGDFNNLRDGFTSIFEGISELAAAEAKLAATTQRTSTIIMIAVIIICIALSVFLGLLNASTIGKPLALSAKIANMLAMGNLDTEQVLSKRDLTLKERKDEVGELALAFNKLIGATKRQAGLINQLEHGDLTVDVEFRSEKDVLGKSLSGLVSEMNTLIAGIVSAANQVASGAQLVSNSSVTLSQGTTEQASAVEELSASLEEVSSQTALNAQNADKASQMAISAKKEAEQGNTQMDALLKAMDAINASSNDISKVIKVIEDIAFQTNILALNASVEAARAGQHGKGFAVVAEEVRSLAGKSSNAAKDTTVMIDGSIKNVQAGIKIANDTAESLKKIVSEVSDATELVGAIAIASKDQSANIEQLNQGIMQVSQVVQNNAATSEESAAASEELSSQAEQLKETVSIFKVKNRKA